MKVSTKGRYALRVMMDLAEKDRSTFVALKDISASKEISVKYLEQIMAALCKGGMVKSERGPQGGYKMARPPEEYTAGKILKLFEGNLAPITCLEDDVNDCPRKESCAILQFWEGLFACVNEYVEGITLADLVCKKHQEEQK